MNKVALKYAFRTLVATAVFGCIKLTMIDNLMDISIDRSTIFYYVTAVFFFLLAWGYNDRLIKNNLRKKELQGLSWLDKLKILALTLGVLTILFTITYYTAIFHFREFLEITCEGTLTQQVLTDVLRAMLLTITVSVFNLLYHSNKVKMQLQNKMSSLELELVASKYQSLKSQISPHFLFNSLNTLTALMYEDRDLASDFTNRLASCYRYILENRDKDVISLDKELSFLDSFIFMMNVRHKLSLKISMHINLEASKYLIPTLSLQMLLENALKHNFYSKEKPLLVTISNTEEFIIVENNYHPRKEKLFSTQLGLENIEKRFSFHTKRPVIIEKTEASFSVKLPLLLNKMDSQSQLFKVS